MERTNGCSFLVNLIKTKLDMFFSPHPLTTTLFPLKELSFKLSMTSARIKLSIFFGLE